ncbi:hypothetical protein [Sphingopyxis chilensis]|uniref:hypothetical protein n=1 Tax=Sphingopyxis chilensis TaxID=180400 RepID=UPI002DDD26DC|nr:hypothetical protein [Sphingopyxis chilensis]
MATQQWHREEPRDVRPFFAAINAERCLDASGLRLFANGDVMQDASFELDEIDFKKLEPVVHIAVADPSKWLPAELAIDELELTLIARHGFLKRSEILASVSLGDPLPSTWSISADALARFGGGRNMLVTLAICLRSDRAPAPGSPFVPGHWIAKKSFLLRSRSMPTLFDLRVRTDEEWTAAGYPPKTFYSVEYLGGIDAELEEGASVATVYVHADAHNKMVSSQIGEALQPMLGAEIIAAILVESLKDWQNADQVDPASPLTTLLKQLGKEKPLTLQGLQALISRPSLLKATLQDRLSVVAAVK